VPSVNLLEVSIIADFLSSANVTFVTPTLEVPFLTVIVAFVVSTALLNLTSNFLAPIALTLYQHSIIYTLNVIEFITLDIMHFSWLLLSLLFS
jgi:hypothetical protein